MMFKAASTLRSIQQIVLMPVTEKRNQQALWLTWAALIAGGLTCALLLKMSDLRIALMIVSAVVLATGIAWWMIFVGCVQRQCTQINRQLVPALTQKTILLTASLWLIGSVLLALITASQIGSLFLLWFVISLGMCLCVWFSRFPKMTALFAIAITIFLGGKIDLNYFESGENTCFATILATLTFAVFTFARILLPRKRRSDHEYRHKSEYLAKAQELIHQPLCIIDALLSSRALYLWFLKRAIRIQASPTQLMSFMFGPQGHWSKTAIYSVFMISLIASFGVFAPSGSRQQPNSLLYLSALIWVYTSIGITSKDWLQTRREQNLLLLTPHFPQGRKMNESMGDILVSSHNAKFAQLVIVFVAFFLINVSLKNTDRFQIVAGVETLLTVYLILLGLQFRSFAHLKSKPDFDLSAIFRALVIVVFTLSPVALSGIFFSVTTTCIVLLAYIFGGITFLIWRCRRMLDGPASLPAGRLADN